MAIPWSELAVRHGELVVQCRETLDTLALLEAEQTMAVVVDLEPRRWGRKVNR